MAGDIKVAVASGVLDRGTGQTTDFTVSGFGTPKACIVIHSFDTADDTSILANSRVSIGFSDFTNNFCIAHQDNDFEATVNCDAFKSNTFCYRVLTDAGAVTGGVASAITDGVRLTNTDGNAGADIFTTVIMFGGADLKISLDSITTPNSIGGTTLVTTGIDQDLVFFIGTDIAAEDVVSSGINNSFGVAHIDTSDHLTFVNRCVGWASDEGNAAGSPAAILSTDRVLDIITETGGQDWGIELTAATTTSYTITERDAASGIGMEIYALALDLDDRKSQVGTVDAPTSGASWTPSVSLGFIPQYVGLGLNLSTSGTIDTIMTGSNAGPIGISSNAGSGQEGCISWYNEDAAATINANSLFRSRVIDFRNDDVTIILQDHSHSSFNSGGWTYTINTENESQIRKWLFWTIEEAAEVNPSGVGAQTLAALLQSGIGVMQPGGSGVQTLASLLQAGVGIETFTSTGIQLLANPLQSGVGVMQPSGSGVQNLANLLQAGVGVEIFTSTGIQTLTNLLQAGVGIEIFTGAGTQFLANFLQSGVGVMQPSGSGIQTLANLLQAGVGVEIFTGTGIQLLAALLQAGVGVMQPSGAGIQILANLLQAGVGNSTEVFTGTGAQLLANFLQSGVGVMQPSGAGTQILANLLQVGVGVMQPSGAGVQILVNLLQAGVGIETFTGAGAQLLADLLQAGAGELILSGVGAQVLAVLTQSATGVMFPAGAGAQVLVTLIQTGTGAEIFIGTAAQTLAALNQAGVGLGLAVPSFVAEFIALLQNPAIGVSASENIIITLGRDVGV